MADLNPLNYLIEKLESGVHALRVKQTGNIVETVKWNKDNTMLGTGSTFHDPGEDDSTQTAYLLQNNGEIFEQSIYIQNELDVDISIEILIREAIEDSNPYGAEILDIYIESGDRISLYPEVGGNVVDADDIYEVPELRMPLGEFTIIRRIEEDIPEGGTDGQLHITSQRRYLIPQKLGD